MQDYIQALEEIAGEYADGDATCVPRIDVWVGRDGADGLFRWGSMQGASKRLKAFTIRMKSDVLYWERHGEVVTEEKYAGRKGLFCGLLMVFSAETGEPLAIINEGYLQHMRVGARIGLSAKYLARPDSRTLGMIGSGGMARTHAMAMCAVRPIERIRVFSPTREHREFYATEMAKSLGIEVTPVDDPEAAVQGADILCLCTDSIVPVIQKDWVKPGMHLTEVNPSQLEFDPSDPSALFDVVFTFAPTPIPLGHTKPLAPGNIEFAGSLDTVKPVPAGRLSGDTGVGDFIDKQRLVKKARVVYLTDLVRGGQGRLRNDEVTFHGHAGEGGTQGLAFIAIGPRIYEEARRRGMGREIPTEWFLQDIRD